MQKEITIETLEAVQKDRPEVLRMLRAFVQVPEDAQPDALTAALEMLTA